MFEESNWRSIAITAVPISRIEVVMDLSYSVDGPLCLSINELLILSAKECTFKKVWTREGSQNQSQSKEFYDWPWTGSTTKYEVPRHLTIVPSPFRSRSVWWWSKTGLLSELSTKFCIYRLNLSTVFLPPAWTTKDEMDRTAACSSTVQ